jgi:hypothetical protein
MRSALRSLCILRFLMRTGGSTSESFIQNGLYILQEAGGEELGCVFFLDRQGPRSREIFENLLDLHSEGKVELKGGSGGFVVAITEKGTEFICKGGEWGGHFYDLPPVRIPEKMIDSIFSLLHSGEGLKIEPVGVALYFLRSAAGADIIEQVKQAKMEEVISPDFDEREIVRSYKKLKRTKLRSE